MGFMAFLAIRNRHFSRVRLMTLGALRNLAVDAVAERAVKRAVLTLVVSQLRDLRCVAGGAGIGHFSAKGDV